MAALGAALAVGNPAPYSAVVRLPDQGIHLASASPERFLSRDGRRVWSSPIKGTAPKPEMLTEKDRAENLMIVDLVRNDLGRVCEYGTVEVPALWSVEHHPGLVHLVSTVEGRLRRDHGWADAIDATFPPGSVTGTPKLAALEGDPPRSSLFPGLSTAALWAGSTPTGAAGDLNVAIRTFWIEAGRLHLGTGGAITWDSDAAGEWAETELKARRLLDVASPRTGGGRAVDVVGQLWIDGDLQPAAEATVSAVDHGVTVGDGVFETMKVVRGRAVRTAPPPREATDLRRAHCRLPVPFEDEVLAQAVAEVIAANPDAGRVRSTLTGGPGPLGSDRGAHPPTTIVAAAPLVPWEPRTSIVVVPWKRNEHGALAGVKSTSYAENVIALEFARDRGASEAIFANTSGQLCEGTGTEHLRRCRGSPGDSPSLLRLPGRHHTPAPARAGRGG